MGSLSPAMIQRSSPQTKIPVAQYTPAWPAHCFATVLRQAPFRSAALTKKQWNKTEAFCRDPKSEQNHENRKLAKDPKEEGWVDFLACPVRFWKSVVMVRVSQTNGPPTMAFCLFPFNYHRRGWGGCKLGRYLAGKAMVLNKVLTGPRGCGGSP